MIGRSINALLIDSEATSLENLKQKIGEFCKQVNVVAAISKTYQIFPLIRNLKPDVLFIGVQLQGSYFLNLLDELKNYESEIIFTTYENDICINAFRMSGFQYLIKPVSIENLEKVVMGISEDRAVFTKKRMQVLKSVLGMPINPAQNMAVREKEGLNFVVMNNIVRIEADAEGSRFFLTTDKTVLSTTPLRDLEEMLTPYHFFRVHNNQLVNLALIQKFQMVTGGQIILKNGDKIDIDRRKQNEFMKTYREQKTLESTRVTKENTLKRCQKES